MGPRGRAFEKKTIIVFGDADQSGNVRGLPSVMSTHFAKKMRQSARVVSITEFRTSKLCSCCHQELKKQRKCFTVLRCANSDCIQRMWNHDINAFINILNLFREL